MYKHYCAGIVFCAFICVVAGAEEAVEHSGVRHRGTLKREASGWTFRDLTDSRVPMSRIAFIRYDADAVPTPGRLPTHTLLLPGDQRVTGTLISVGDNQIAFAPCWGGPITLDREKVVGIIQSDHALVVASERFSKPSKECVLLGSPTIDANALRFDRAGQGLSRSWKISLRDGAVRLLVRSAVVGLAWRCEVLGIDAKPSVVLDANGWRAMNVKTAYPVALASNKDRLLAIEVRDRRLRIFLDDICLGESPLASSDAITGIRIVTSANGDDAKPGQVRLLELHANRRIQALKIPASDPDRDVVQLEHGEQLFGRVLNVDERTVHFDARFGKRSLAWSDVHGIVFANKKSTGIVDGSEVSFRAAPGYPVDTVHCELIRWDNGRLLIQHDLLGAFALLHDQLLRVRFPMK